MLSLRRGTVAAAGDPAAPVQRLEVELDGERRPAVGDIALVGAAEAGDEVVVNVAARDLGLGSGGFDLVHVNLTMGLTGAGVPGAHVMKLNYTSLQHAVLPVEGDALTLPVATPVGVVFLHGQLAAAAWAFRRAAPHARLGYILSRIGAEFCTLLHSLIMQDDVGKQFHSYGQFAVVIDQSHFSEFVHEVGDARTRGADHFSQRLVA